MDSRKPFNMAIEKTKAKRGHPLAYGKDIILYALIYQDNLIIKKQHSMLNPLLRIK